MRALMLLLAALLQQLGHADISSVDVFVSGEPVVAGQFFPAQSTAASPCQCLRIPSLAATPTIVWAFAECRGNPWAPGDLCAPPAADAPQPPKNESGRHIAAKHSVDGGWSWSALTIVAPGAGQPVSVYDPKQRATLLFYRGALSGYANVVGLLKIRDGETLWDAPTSAFALGPCPGLPPPALATCMGVAPGPGNALVLSGSHPSHPNRILLPVWFDYNVLGAPGERVSAVFFSDDGGLTFNESQWPTTPQSNQSAYLTYLPHAINLATSAYIYLGN